MPIESCGSRGFRWGKNGHCYDGPSRSLNRKKAIDQGLAITGGGRKFKKEMAESQLSGEELEYVKSELNKRPENSFMKSISEAFTKMSEENNGSSK